MWFTGKTDLDKHRSNFYIIPVPFESHVRSQIFSLYCNGQIDNSFNLSPVESNLSFGQTPCAEKGIAGEQGVTDIDRWVDRHRQINRHVGTAAS